MTGVNVQSTGAVKEYNIDSTLPLLADGDVRDLVDREIDRLKLIAVCDAPRTISETDVSLNPDLQSAFS